MQNESVILNLTNQNNFMFDDEEISNVGKETIHIMTRKRNGRNFLTVIKGINKDFDLKRILSSMKKSLNCNGAIIENKTHGIVIQLNGNHREDLVTFLDENDIASKEQVKLHGV